MIRLARDFRLIPVVLLATISLFALKVSGLVFDGGYTLAERMQNRYRTGLVIAAPESVPDYPKIIDKRVTQDAPVSKHSWAQEMFNYKNTGTRDITGSAGSTEKPSTPSAPPLKVSEKPPAAAKLEVGDLSVSLEPGGIISPGERAILERLQKRRKEIETRSHELDMRESLIKAAEKRLEAKIDELKGMETRINTAIDNRDKDEVKRFNGLVSMYEDMKPKDAARIFERLDQKILVEVSTRMKSRAMSAILALMKPEAAERLTVDLAKRTNAQTKSQNPDQLPKIDGKPSGS